MRYSYSLIASLLNYLCCSAEESIADILQAAYTNFDDDDADYPDTSNIMKMSSFPKPVPTKSSLLMQNARRESEKEVKLSVILFPL